MKRLIHVVSIAALLAPQMLFAADAPARALIYHIVDSGFFVASVMAIYAVGIIVGIQTVRRLGSGTLRNMMKWLTWGLFFGVLFQGYIFIFDYKKVGGYPAYDVSVGWHVFFVLTVLCMTIAMAKVLRKD